MGLFDESASFFEELLKKENYTEEEKAYFRDFSEKSPVYGEPSKACNSGRGTKRCRV